MKKVDITAIVPTRDEEKNIQRCLSGLQKASKIYVLDSGSADRTPDIARSLGAEVVHFEYSGGYPKKRQWALDHLQIDTSWVLLVDADEYIPDGLWTEIIAVISKQSKHSGYFVKKGFHFMRKRFRYGGFSHQAVLLFKAGEGRFENLFDGNQGGLDIEVHERLIVDGSTGILKTPLIHEDFKGLEAYIDRHNKYSTWEANVRWQYLKEGKWGISSIRAKLVGNAQERRRFLKGIAMRMPFEPLLWFLYHYIFRMGFLEGRPGFIASMIRSQYIAQTRYKIWEMRRNSFLPSDIP